MPINSRAKGIRGELEWAKWLRDNLGLEASRGQQHKGTPDSPDVLGGIPGTHPEVKRVEKLNIPQAMAKAVADAGPDQIPYVASRRNQGEWLVTTRACDLNKLATLVVGARLEGSWIRGAKTMSIKCPYCKRKARPKGDGERQATCKGCGRDFKVCCHNGHEWGEVNQPAHIVCVHIPVTIESPRTIGIIRSEKTE